MDDLQVQNGNGVGGGRGEDGRGVESLGGAENTFPRAAAGGLYQRKRIPPLQGAQKILPAIQEVAVRNGKGVEIRRRRRRRRRTDIDI